MKKLIYIVSLLFLSTFSLFSNINSKSNFIENKGQWESDILFSLQNNGIVTNISKDAIYFDFFKINNNHITGDVIRMKFVNSNNFSIKPISKQNNKINYFIGNESDKWVKNVNTYEKVLFENVYSGIKLELMNHNNSPRYDFIVEPYADPSQIQISFDGVNSVNTNNDDLIIKTLNSVIENKNLLAFQMKNNEKQIVPCKFKLIDNKISFNLGEYDKSRELIIDPVVYSSYYGGSGEDKANVIEFINDTTLIFAGSTSSNDLRTTVGAYEEEYADRNDAFVTTMKIRNSEYTPLFTTYLGSLEFDEIVDFEIEQDFVLLVGNTKSPDFPLKNPFMNIFQGKTDIFISSLGLSGDTLLQSSYYGGSEDDIAAKVGTTSSSQYIITGSSNSQDIQVLGGPQNGNYKGKKDILVFTVNSKRTSVVQSSYLGGASDDVPYDLYINPSTNNIAITGYTMSVTGTDNDFPIKPERRFGQGGAYDDSFNGRKDAFVMQLSSNAQSLDISTYIGGSGDDIGKGVWLSSGDDLYICGETYDNYDQGLEFPVTVDESNIKGKSDIFIAKFNEVREIFSIKTQTIGYSRVIESNGDEYIESFQRSKDNLKFGIALSSTGLFPEVEFNSFKPGANIIYTELNDVNGDVIKSKLHGGSDDEFPSYLAYDRFNGYIISGYTISDDFETTVNASHKTKFNNSDIVLIRSNPNELNYLAPKLNSILCVGSSVSIQWSGNALSADEGYNIGYMTNSDPKTFTAISNDINSESYLWEVPEELSGKDSITIRISHPSGSFTQNEEYFSVNESAKINLFELITEDTVCIGDSIVFNSNSIGTGIEYVWYKDDIEISRSEKNILKINSASIDDSGIYKVSVVNECPPQQFSENTISIFVSPNTKAGEIPSSITKNKGETLELSTVSKGVELSYEWYKDDSVVPSQNGSKLTLSNLSLSDSGNYKCVVSGKCGVDTTNISEVTIEDVMGNVKQQLIEIADIVINKDGTILIEMNSNKLFNLSLFRLDGTLHNQFNNKSNSFTLDLNNNSNGIYWLLVEMNNKLYKHKITYMK